MNPFPHPWVTIYRSEDGYRAVWVPSLHPLRLRFVIFRKLGILTAAGRRAWAMKKNAKVARMRTKAHVHRIEKGRRDFVRSLSV